MNIKHPIYLDLSLTTQCNLKCDFCYAASNVNKQEIKYLTLKDIERLFDEIDELEILRVGFEGGEPFIRDDIIDILKSADKHNFEYYINTNGTLITEEIAYDLHNTSVSKVCVSIDGHKEEIHDLCRGTKGAFHKAIEGIKNLQKYNIEVEAIFTAGKKNADYIIETLQFIESLNIHRMAIMVMADVGSAADNDNSSMSFNQWENALLKLTDYIKTKKSKVRVNIVPAGESKYPWELYLPLISNKRADDINLWINNNSMVLTPQDEFGCTAGKSSLAIDGMGNVYGCSFMISNINLIAGNILKESLINVWNNSNIFKSIRSMKLADVQGKCKKCNYLRLCKGGCRACSYFQSNNIFSSDMRCPIAKGVSY